MTGDHLNLIHGHHLVPGVASAWHCDHIALVWVDHLTQISGVNGHFELESLGEGTVDVDQICCRNKTSVAVSHSVEGLFEQTSGVRLDPSTS